MRTVRLASALGVEVKGMDLSRSLTDAQVADLRQVWLEHLVLLFRDQSLTPKQLIDFSVRFGKLETHENYQSELRQPDHPELLVVRTTHLDGRRIAFGQQWHSDLSYTLRPSMGSCLYCLKMPEVGGDTLFSNTIMAYEALSATMQSVIEPLEAIHDITNGRSFIGASHEHIEAARRRNPPVVQPVVRVHPETGRKALFVSEWMCSRIAGTSAEESLGLVRFLCQHSVREEFTFRQRWRPGDVLMWDNRATVHMAMADYPDSAERELLRTSIKGNLQGCLSAAPA